jgi:hypothetical protein
LKKFLDIFFGILLAIVIPVIGMLITKLIEHGIGVILSIILFFFIGIYLFRSKNKQIGIGIFIGLIPVILFTLFVIEISKLH